MKNEEIRLPNADFAQADLAKLEGYLLSVAHPVGRAKALYFQSVGFSLSDSETFAEMLKAHTLSASVISKQETAYGEKFVLDGPVTSPSGKTF